MIIETVAEFAAGLGLDAAKEHFSSKLEEKKLHDKLVQYIESQRKYNEMCTLAEEIDFQGLVEYIDQNLLGDVSIRIFDLNRKKRGQAREEILRSAISYAKANTDAAKYRVKTAIAICLDIIRSFYHSQISMKDYILVAEIADVVTEDIQLSTETITSTVATAVTSVKNEILAQMKSGSLFSIDKAVALAEAGNVADIGVGFRKVLDHISLSHPLHPDFRYDFRDGMMISKPVTQKAKVLYPPRINLTGAIRFGDQYFNDPNGNPLDYAYRHQLPIVMEVEKAVKLLGDKPDPSQDEIVGLVGKTVVAEPPQFPPAFPCSIKVGNQIFFDDVLLRTQEIEDDGTYVIGNKEEEGHFYFEVRINPKKPSKPDFKVNMIGGSNREHLKYLEFMRTLSTDKDIHIYVIAAGEDLLAGYINEIDLKTGFTSIDEEIDFLERFCDIEEYFDVVMIPDGAINEKEYETIIHISELIRKDEVTGTWSEATFTGILDQHFREELVSMDKELYCFSYVGVSHVDIFGAEFEFRFMRTFNCARMVDFDKVKRKAEVLDDGDDIRITFRAGDDKGTIDTLKIPEKIERAS